MKLSFFYLSLLFILFCLSVKPVSADTIPENAQIYGQWHIDGSPYVIMGLATIPSDSTLTIDPGVRVEFRSSVIDSAFISPYLEIGWIKAFGKMIALGTESDSIIFTSSGEGCWAGIHFENVTENSHLKYCDIGKCRSISDLLPGSDQSYEGGLTFKKSRALIENTDLSDNYTGLSADSSEIIISKCRISNNNGGVGYYGSSGKVSSSFIGNNGYAGISSHNSSLIVENNLVEEQLFGIDSYQSFDTIIGNVVRNNSYGGINISFCNPFVFRNIIYGSNSGIRCDRNPLIANNTITDNIYFGIYCDWNAKPVLINDIIYGNGNLITYDANDSVVFANCLIQADTVPAGLIDAGGNLFNEDPLFINPGDHDYSLNASSPCINRGISYFEWEGEVMLALDPDQYIGAAPDIGAIETTIVNVKDHYYNGQRHPLFTVFPNPSAGSTVGVHCQKAESGNLLLVIMNQMGSPVYQQEIKSDDFLINISNWSPGVYLMAVYEERKVIEYTKIVVL